MARHLASLALILGLILLALARQQPVRGEGAAQPGWSPKAAATYLDGRAREWLDWSFAAKGQATVCLSCHTTMPYLLARPTLSRLLGETAPGDVERKAIGSVQKRVANWKAIVADPTSDADPFVSYFANARKPASLGVESVLNALVLVQHDAGWAKGNLSQPTRLALEHLWGQQQENGAWLWLDFDDWPWAKDGVYYGAALAALAVGTAGETYYNQPDVKGKTEALRKYLRTQLPNQWQHNRVMTLWASSRLPGILAEEEKKRLIQEIERVQEPDGGWSLAKLGERAPGMSVWQSQGGDPEGTISDGFATGLIVLALRGAGVPSDNPRLMKAREWLATHQKNGVWPATYLNRNRDGQTNVGKFMRDAATAFAVLGLTADN